MSYSRVRGPILDPLLLHNKLDTKDEDILKDFCAVMEMKEEEITKDGARQS